MALFKPNVQKMLEKRNVHGLSKALSHEDGIVRYAAAEALVRIGAAAVEPLVAALRHSNADLRRMAAGVLGQIGDSRAVEPLIAALHDSDPLGRRNAADALGKIGDARAVEPLTAVMHDSMWDVRIHVAEALGRIGDARAVDPLAVALRDPNEDVRKKVGEALGRIGDAHAVEPLIAALHDSRWYVRQKVVEALGAIGDARAVEPLIAALRDADEDVRAKVADALRKIGDPRANEALAGFAEHASRDRIFLFFARSPNTPYGQVFSISSREDWIRGARTKAGLPDADVILIQESEWDAPTLNSLEPAVLQAAYPIIQGAIRTKLREYGVPARKLGPLTQNVLASPNPLTGLVVLTVVYTKAH